MEGKKQIGKESRRCRKKRGRASKANREMRFGGPGTEGGGRGTERIPTGITSVHVFMSVRGSSQAFGKNAYLLPIRIS